MPVAGCTTWPWRNASTPINWKGAASARRTCTRFGKHYRQTFPYADQVFSQTVQSVIEQVDLAFQAFFRRVKAGEKAGYPRFKGPHRFNSFLFKQFGDGRTAGLGGV